MNRTRLDIKREILELARHKVKPTVLMQSGNLSWKLMREVCRELCDADMLTLVPATPEERRRDARTSYFYRATPSGLAYIPLFERLLSAD